nr:type II toxin-antitoxin system prevent-host-death family antitoxin [Actinomycetales bacterium]
MKSRTATEASRNFADLLDAVEAGESVTITRAGRPVAEIRPVSRHTGGELRAAMEESPRLDRDFEYAISEALEFVDQEVQDPWANA